MPTVPCRGARRPAKSSYYRVNLRSKTGVRVALVQKVGIRSYPHYGLIKRQQSRQSAWFGEEGVRILFRHDNGVYLLLRPH